MLCESDENRILAEFVLNTIMKFFLEYVTSHEQGNAEVSESDTRIHATNKCMCGKIINRAFDYRSVLGKRPWALKHTSRFWPAWALTRDILSIRLYRSCYIDPLKCGTWALVREWALARDTTVYM